LIFYEFFAGGGMARLGLGPGWRCAFANDLDPKKAAAYRARFGRDDSFVLGDVAALSTENLPGRADLAWASFPCQDLSLAGAGGGLDASRSGTFWPFWRLIESLRREGRAPRLVVLENVRGAISSHGGRDFAAIVRALAACGYRVGPLVIDAARFLPQSRPRLFVVAADAGFGPPENLLGEGPDAAWHPQSLRTARERLAPAERAAWVWWRLPPPAERTKTLGDLVEDDARGVRWHTAEETERLLGMTSPVNLEKIRAARDAGRRVVGTLYRRTRLCEDGVKRQRAEVRFDGVAGCLRTPAGGSSRQTILIVEGGAVRSRLLSAREAARLMGLPEDYELPPNYNEAYHLVGDGVAVPVVRHLAANLLEPLLKADDGADAVALQACEVSC
jgi:DNA (cytosine-5)-methyltransferase 1